MDMLSDIPWQMTEDWNQVLQSFKATGRKKMRSAAAGGITSAMIAVIAKAGFISPMNFNLFLFCSIGYVPDRSRCCELNFCDYNIL
jgi:hypothetical protein